MYLGNTQITTKIMIINDLFSSPFSKRRILKIVAMQQNDIVIR